MTSRMHEAALEYAELGYSVVPVYGWNEEGCQCGNMQCRSPGKHPHAAYAPHGVKDATRRKSTIRSWPKDINIGLALGTGNKSHAVAFDVDDRAAAKKFLEADWLAQQTALTQTARRGAHIWFRTRGELHTFYIKQPDGSKVGELRGTDAYVIAPPSMGPQNKRYKWLSGPLEPLESVEDTLLYVQSLCAQIGLEIVTDLDELVAYDGEIPSTPVKASRWPKSLNDVPNLQSARRIVRGERSAVPPDADRSGKLWAFGHSIVTQVLDNNKRARTGGKVSVQGASRKRRATKLTTARLAQLIKRADQVHYHKYADDVRAGRRSQAAADKEYWRLAGKLLPQDEIPSKSLQAPKGEAPLFSVARKQDYEWDKREKYLFFNVNPEKNQIRPVCNFQVRIVHEVRINRGDEEEENAWLVEALHPSGVKKQFMLSAQEKSSTPAFEKAVNGNLPSRFIVFPGMYDHLKTSIQEHAERKDVKEKVVYATTGWVTEKKQRYFLMPSMNGAIGRNGMNPNLSIDTEYLHDDEVVSHGALQQYGNGVTVPTDAQQLASAWESFIRLVECGKRSVTLPVALQVLVGPLRSAGAGDTPPLLHVFGRTGHMKTTLCMAALSIFGTFRLSDAPPTHWGSTPATIQNFLHALRDLTLFIDDYKVSSADKRSVPQVIQPYATKSARQRSTSTQKVQASLSPQSFILSNGEDMWEREASVAARTTLVEIGSGDIILERISRVQRDIAGGSLQMFGAAYIQWLARQDAFFVEDGFTDIVKTHSDKMQKRSKGKVHLRVIASYASVLAVTDVLKNFATATAPQHLDRIRAWQRELTKVFAVGVSEQVEEVEQLSPLSQLVDYMVSQFASREGYLAHTSGMGEDTRNYPDIPSQRAELLGWYDDYYVYLGKQKTFATYRAAKRREGDPPDFSWKAITQEVRNGYDGTVSLAKLIKTGDSWHTVRVARMPLSIVQAAVEGDEA